MRGSEPVLNARIASLRPLTRMQLMRLQDKVILVTGSTTGIGEAIARRVVAEGGRVMIHGRDAERGQALVAELGERATLRRRRSGRSGGAADD